MPSTIIYRAMQPGEEAAVSEFILESFEEFIAPGYTEEGIGEFRRYVEPLALADRSRGSYQVLLASDGERLAGAIEIRDDDHVSLLFVGKQWHRQGVGKALLDHAIAIIRRAKPELAGVTVNSSRYGVPFYEQLGFRQTGPERTVNGIVFVPMALKLD